MSYKPNTYIDDVAFKQALTSYNEKIKNTYTNIPEEDSSVDYRYLVGVASPTGKGEENSQSYKSSSLKYSENNKKLEVPNLSTSEKISATSADVTGTVTVGNTSVKTTITSAEIKVGNASGTTITPAKIMASEASMGSADITGYFQREVYL